jgi:hydrogenase expression/formation protein HypC
MCLGVPGLILSIEGTDAVERMARVSFGGIVKEVSLAYLPQARVGDYVVVHVGFAISRIDGEEAQKVFAYLKEMDELVDLKTEQERQAVPS